MKLIIERLSNGMRESFLMAMGAVRTNKTRSALTLVGIAVGVFSIIGVMTAMGALVNAIQNGMSELGANTFQVQKNSNSFGNDTKERMKNRNRKYISYEQAVAVKERVTFAAAVGIESFSGGKTGKYGPYKTNPNVQIMAENVDGFSTNNWTVQDGRMFTVDEVNNGKLVAVISKGLKDKLFPNTDPLGKVFDVDGNRYEVVGTLEDKGSMFGDNGSTSMVVPITSFLRNYGTDRDIHIMVTSTSKETYNDCMEQVRGILRVLRHVEPGEEDDFYIFSNESMIDQFNDLTKYVRLGIMGVSAIALLAAGVGIMNIMLVSVTERTREIGIRKAIGARKNNILSQFIFEAVLLSEIGGAMGIILGILCGNIIALVMEIPPVIPWDWVAIGFFACSLVGIIFGTYPAWKASNLDPIEALRYEN